ncbi:hypothetical protein ES703_75459 [subsurface metagenome]
MNSDVSDVTYHDVSDVTYHIGSLSIQCSITELLLLTVRDLTMT